jgi:GNAT superfamily N-acetyltransferase
MSEMIANPNLSDAVGSLASTPSAPEGPRMPTEPPPAHRHHLRPATAGDFALIHAARALGLQEHVARIWGWDEADQRARFRAAFDPDQYQVVVVDGRSVGAISVRRADDVVLLADLEILPPWRGQGIGTALVRQVVGEAHACALPVTLQVLRGNPARRLYERLGFVVTGETATHVTMRLAPPEPATSGG